MADDKTVRGTNFTCFHAGPMEGWAQYFMDPPEVPRPTRGKLFLRKFLGSAGLEMSLNVVSPGQGQFLVDGGCIDVREGSVLRLTPAAARAWRNNSDAPLYFLCIQYRADSVIDGGTADRQKGA